MASDMRVMAASWAERRAPRGAGASTALRSLMVVCLTGLLSALLWLALLAIVRVAW
jgi:hypothetical protein